MRKVVPWGLAALCAALVLSFAPVSRAASPTPHILMVLLENTSYEGVVGNSSMPFLNSLIAANGSVRTTGLCHPSLGNYLALTGGATQGCPPDTVPADATYPGPQLTDQLAAAGIAWKAYMEDMPVACDLTDTFSPGHYDVNHNPFMYFNSVRNSPSQCNSDVPYPQLTADLNAGTAPPFLWVSPNTVHDMHDGTPAQADAFLQGLVNQVRASSWWTAASRIVITWDEGTQSDQVLTLVVGSAHGTAANGGNHYGTLRGLEEAYGVGLLGHSAATNVGDILPLLAGSPPPASPSSAAPRRPPPPTHAASPAPSPATPSPTPSPSPSPSPSALPTLTSPSAPFTPSAGVVADPASNGETGLLAGSLAAMVIAVALAALARRRWWTRPPSKPQ